MTAVFSGLKNQPEDENTPGFCSHSLNTEYMKEHSDMIRSVFYTTVYKLDLCGTVELTFSIYDTMRNLHEFKAQTLPWFW